MLRFALAMLMAILPLTIACSDSAEVTDGTGGTEPLEVGPTCMDFCVRAIGDCEAFLFGEAECRQGCQSDLNEEFAKSEACGEAVEAVFQCATALEDCQALYDWRDQEPTNSFPCRPKVLVVDNTCFFGI